MRGRGVLWLLGPLLALVVVLIAVVSGVVVHGFETLEEAQAQQDLAHARQAMTVHLEGLADLARDWAYWDDTYEYIVTHDPAYVEANLMDASFEVAKLEVIGYFDTDRNLVRLKAFDLEEGEEAAPPEGLLSFLESHLASLLPASDAQGAATGLLLLGDRTLVTAVVHILNSDSEGPPRGYLVMGRFLNAGLIADLAETTQLDLSLDRLDTAGLAPRLEEARQRLQAVRPGEPLLLRADDRVSVHCLLPDLAGDPALMMSVSRSRDIYAHGRSTAVLLAVVLLLIPAFFGVGGILGLRRSRKALVESEERHRAVVEQGWDGVVLLDEKTGRIFESNAAFQNLVGYSGLELGELHLADLTPEDADPLHTTASTSTSPPSLHQVGDRRFLCRDGTTIELETSVSPLQLGKRRLLCLVVRDISERKRKWLWHYALHDPLTGLPNRALFNDRLDLALAQARRTNANLAVAFVDLDCFKTVNDSLGHGTGDLVLQRVAERLRALVREGDTVARLGGDEFRLLLPNVKGRQHLPRIGERMLETFSAPLEVGDRQLRVTASIGLALFPDDGDSGTELILCADSAMYRVKEQGRCGYGVWHLLRAAAPAG